MHCLTNCRNHDYLFYVVLCFFVFPYIWFIDLFTTKNIYTQVFNMTIYLFYSVFACVISHLLTLYSHYFFLQFIVHMYDVFPLPLLYLCISLYWMYHCNRSTIITIFLVCMFFCPHVFPFNIHWIRLDFLGCITNVKVIWMLTWRFPVQGVKYLYQ